MKLKTIITVLFVLLGILLFATNVQAAEYYTVSTANPSNPTQVDDLETALNTADAQFIIIKGAADEVVEFSGFTTEKFILVDTLTAKATGTVELPAGGTLNGGKIMVQGQGTLKLNGENYAGPTEEYKLVNLEDNAAVTVQTGGNLTSVTEFIANANKLTTDYTIEGTVDLTRNLGLMNQDTSGDTLTIKPDAILTVAGDVRLDIKSNAKLTIEENGNIYIKENGILYAGGTLENNGNILNDGLFETQAYPQGNPVTSGNINNTGIIVNQNTIKVVEGTILNDEGIIYTGYEGSKVINETDAGIIVYGEYGDYVGITVEPNEEFTYAYQDKEAVESTITSYEGENGTVTAPDKAAVNDEVTLVVTPQEGYQLASITVKATINGEEVEIEVVDGKFLMPLGDVKIDATFEEIPTEGEKDETPNTSARNYIYIAVAIATVSIAGIWFTRKNRK